MKETRSKEIAVPGDTVGAIEEGDSGQGTYEDQGRIYSMFTGRMRFDPKNKVFQVDPLTSSPPFPREGEEVIARVITVQNSLATLEIVKISDRVLGRTFTGLLHHSRAGRIVGSRLKKYLKPGDIVRVKVVYDKNLIHVSMVGQRFGAIQAYCSKCGGRLEKRGARNLLYCVDCGWKDTRLTSSDYGTLKW